MFSTLDFQSGYWQIAMDDKDCENTTFITKWGLFEYIGCHSDSVTHRVRFRGQWNLSSETSSVKPFLSTWTLSLLLAMECIRS